MKKSIEYNSDGDIKCKFWIDPKGLEWRLGEIKIKGEFKTNQTKVLLKPAITFGRVLETWGELDNICI